MRDVQVQIAVNFWRCNEINSFFSVVEKKGNESLGSSQAKGITNLQKNRKTDTYTLGQVDRQGLEQTDKQAYKQTVS
jgi:hypothetical protein